VDDEVAESHAFVTNSRNSICRNNLWHQRYEHFEFSVPFLTKGRMVVEMLDRCQKEEAYEKCLAGKKHKFPLMKGRLGEPKVFLIFSLLISANL
jgi:hypothetical protein